MVYRSKLYVFINEENQDKFITKPTQYWNLLLPMKLPRNEEDTNVKYIRVEIDIFVIRSDLN